MATLAGTRTYAGTQTLRRRRRLPRNTGRFLLLSFEALLFLLPIYWMLATSFKPEAETTAIPIQLFPAHPTLKNYLDVLNSPEGSIFRWTFNSLFAALAHSIAHVTVAALAAYPLARMRFRGRNKWFWFILSSLMIPSIVLLLPTYVMMLQLGWIDSFNALIWPVVPSVFGVFLLRQAFLGIPMELEDAARIDGANVLQVLRHIIIPAAIPALVTLLVFSFLFNWNNYVFPLFVVHGDMQTLPVGLGKFQTRYVTEYGKLMAAAAIAAIPALIAFVIAQRYIVQGITTTGLKDT
jgi:multiple sugar transport system permease protein